MNFSINPLLWIFLFSFTSISFSQERTITGFVKTLENIEVVNAEVKVLSNKVTVFTDSLGNFKVSCLPKDKIKISAKGFFPEKVKIDEKTKELSIKLLFKPGEKNLDVAIGYGHINEKDKSYAISNFRNEKTLEFAKYTDMLQYIVNTSPSIIVGGGGLIIRGSNSLLGSNTALILLDGIEVSTSDLSLLAPTDVKSVTILKDASAAIYGSRGANGVVLISTIRRGDEN